MHSALQLPRLDEGPQALELTHAMHCAARGVAAAAPSRSAAPVTSQVTIRNMRHLA
jgi:hypothetical protein